MEPLWSPVVATSGNRSQTAPPPKAQKQARCENRNGSLRSEFVFVKETAESIASMDTPLVARRRAGPRLGERRLLVERAVWPMGVVVGDVLAQNRLELSARDVRHPVETFSPGAADPALGVRFRPWRSDRRLDQPQSLR